ncbi:trypsin-like peptidase domain-containing protein [Alteromonas sp. C1M14]|uniref:trypsin-like serine peptidase n=1 Tax=Alteromonas sp. C1M14 TaxID=2841567 RepID=UPI001C08998A|nr:trypsin-like peptidase domain-containing protein [Alteromonas sp. C1M14]MBU2978217.1 trypsin-like peptidase domain-containing protein [Alteromonas sp. C1M14]
MCVINRFVSVALCLLTLPVLAADLTPPNQFPGSGFFKPVPANEITQGYDIQTIVGSADFEKMRDYPPTSELYTLSRRVGAVFVNGRPICTGSLVGPDLFLTNEHCAFSAGKAIPLSQYLFSFDYYVDDLKQVSGLPLFKAVALLKYDAKLDYALYQLNQPVGNTLGWFPLADTDSAIINAQQVKIIQHPAGRSKEVVLKNTGLYKKYLNDGVIHYFADTEPGSSGSPVLSADGDTIIALHHSGFKDNQGKGLVNEGIPSSRIYAQIRQFLPQEAPTRRGKQRATTTPAPQTPEAPAARRRSGQQTPPQADVPTTPEPVTPAPSQPKTPPPAEPKPIAPVPAKPAPNTPKPAPVKTVDCQGKGMAVTDKKGNVSCVKW